jgi:cyanate lyase
VLRRGQPVKFVEKKRAVCYTAPMAFTSFSAGALLGGWTLLPNIFMEEHVPYSNGDCVRVYLYGLLLCQNSSSADNTVERMSAVLNLPADDIMSAFEFWRKRGLVQVLETDPIEIKYLPVISNSLIIGACNSTEFAEFHAKVDSIIDGRTVTQTEFEEYKNFITSMQFEPEALLIVIKNCVLAKSPTVGYHYILGIAKNLAYMGLRTRKQVAEKFDIDKQNITELQNLIKELRKKQPAAAKKDFIKHSYDPNKIKELAKNADEIEF